MTQALLRKEIDVIVAWMSYDHWCKDRMQGTIDNIYFIEEYPIEQVTYVRNDRPELTSIINKALASIAEEEKTAIRNKYLAIKYEQGIDPALQASISEPFVQGIDVPGRKDTGLGLSICKKYAQIMGGTIELESEMGKGSLFRVRLPAQVAKSMDARKSWRQAAVTWSSNLSKRSRFLR